MGAPSARLTYVREPGTEACADEEELRRAVAARLGYDPFFAWAPVAVVAHVRRESGAYRAEVTLVDEQGVSRGKRTLSSEGDDCAPLVGALALGISLALDPLSLARKPDTAEASPAPTPAPVDAVAPTAPAGNGAELPRLPAERPAANAASRWRGWAGLAVLGASGATPGFAFGGLVRAKVEHGRLSLAVEAGLDAPTSASAPTGGTVRAWMAQATLLGCGRVWLMVVGCGFVTGGPVVASGVDLAAPRSAVVPYGAFGPRVSVEWPFFGRFRLEGFIEVAVTLKPKAFQVDQVDAFRQSFVAPRVGAGASAQIF
jgi:hypothetical protein